VRGRIGYVWGNGTVLTYVTGGLAYGKVDLEGATTVSGFAAGPPFSIAQAFGHSQVNTGWVVGYGTEGTLAGMPSWTWKIEGLYMDLGTLDAVGSGGSFRTFGTETITINGQVSAHSHFTDGILRGGLNYKFY
jgi:outer membrane immunogenic protein